MAMLDNIEDRLSALDLGDKHSAVMNIVREETRMAREIMDDKLELFAKTIEEDKVNVLYIPTGMMPKPKAESYIKKVASEFKEIISENTRMMYISFSERHQSSPVIHKLEKDKAYIIQMNTGNMPKPKADAYIRAQKEAFGDMFSKEGFKIQIVGVSDAEKFGVFEKVG